MDMSDFQARAAETSCFTTPAAAQRYAKAAICSEAAIIDSPQSEPANDEHGPPASIGKSLGDIMWYVAEVASQLGDVPHDVAKTLAD